MIRFQCCLLHQIIFSSIKIYILIFFHAEGDTIFVAGFIEEIFASNNICFLYKLNSRISWSMMVKKKNILFYSVNYVILFSLIYRFHNTIYFVILNKYSKWHRKLQLFFPTTYIRKLKRIVIFLVIHNNKRYKSLNKLKDFSKNEL